MISLSARTCGDVILENREASEALQEDVSTLRGKPRSTLETIADPGKPITNIHE